MELSELTAYAGEKYQIQEQHKWTDFPGFSVLCHPQTGKWVALLMRQWDSDAGVEIERCDMKCGMGVLSRFQRSYLSPPVRMQGSNWIDIAFDDRTEPEVVFELFDQAVALGKGQGYTVILGSQISGGEARYQETALPVMKGVRTPEKEKIPERLRQMRRLYEYGRESAGARAKSFWRQAVFMQDFEDDCPWTGGDFVRYFPTYQDLTTRQLRGYFTWRACLRRGDFRPIPASVAYIYIYELLNGVGTASPEETLQKMREFEHGFLDSGIGDERMRLNLRRWRLEYAVLQNLPAELARQAADPAMMERDRALAALRSPEDHTDSEVFQALRHFSGKKLENTPVLKNDAERGMGLFAKVWRAAASSCPGDKDLFTLCFGKKKICPWYPLSNTVYYEKSCQEDRVYVLNDCRCFRLKNGIWQSEAYEKLTYDRLRFQGFVHETDARLRRYLKTGRYLQENAADEWVIPYVDAVTEADRRAEAEAARPKITIRLSDLDQIRRDADVTRDSLLTEEDREQYEEAAAGLQQYEAAESANVQSGEATAGRKQYEGTETADGQSGETAADLPLDHVQLQILRALLKGQDPSSVIKENHLMPSVAADAINEALFDEFGDSVVLCEGDRLLPVDDYIQDLEQYLGGAVNG